MKTIEEKLDFLEQQIKNPSFRTNNGRANEINYWVFDYDPKYELIVRERIKYLMERNKKGLDDYNLAVYDFYDMIIDYLIKRGFLEQCYKFEETQGLSKIINAVTHVMKLNDKNSLLVQQITEQTKDNSVVFLTGIGKCFPILRSHKVLNNLNLYFAKTPVVLFFPGKYTEQELILFNEIKDDNYYRAFKLVK